MKRWLLALTAAVLAASAWAQGAPVAGEVTKLDKTTGRITLKHGEIKHLDMPPMTMVFRVREARLLDGVAVGDRVRFTADKLDGQYTVTALSKAP
ncbi:copper-binding protein [Rubrivivax rivuli]|uniref:Copper-binding protein n=1 Tax=Rubrivivax rivuli TaxID=1862385 RepID=A0A437RKV4_9BURK|nr:copper-binding protein [Rubrivivax rivuli]RVU47379.1 copper-binding protein [Rubrivivax rivuli]